MFRQFIGYSSLIVSLLLFGALLLVNIDGGLFFLWGVCAFFLTILLIKGIWRSYPEVFVAMIVIAVVAAIFIPSLNGLKQSGLRNVSVTKVYVYQANINQNPNAIAEFVVEESVEANIVELSGEETDVNASSETAEGKRITINLEPRIVTSGKKGFLLRQVEYAPLQVSWQGIAKIPYAGKELEVKLCNLKCPESRIFLFDLPKGSFSEAQYGSDIKTSSYADTDHVSWTNEHINKGITFTYVPPPYQHVRLLLNPFIGLSSISKWTFVLLGIIGGALAKFLLIPALIKGADGAADSLYNKIKALFGKRKEKRIDGFTGGNFDKSDQDEKSK